MSFFVPKLRLFLSFAVYGVATGSASAQYNSVYNSAGNVKTVTERKLDEINKVRTVNAEPTPTNTNRSFSNQSSSGSTRTREAVPYVNYDYLGSERGFNGLQAARLATKWGYVHATRKTVSIPVIYDAVKFIDYNYYGVKLNDKWGFVNEFGKVVIPIQFDDILSGFHLDSTEKYYKPEALRATVLQAGKKMDIDVHGSTDFSSTGWHSGLTGTKLSYIGKDKDNQGLRPAQLNGKWGYLNEAGDVVIPLRYDTLSCKDNGYYAVKADGKWFFVDKNDKMLIYSRFDNILTPFTITGYSYSPNSVHQSPTGTVVVVNQGKKFYINEKGKVIGEKTDYVRGKIHVEDELIKGTFTDPRDTNLYGTVKICAQTWMTENLNASSFANGDPIPEVTTIEQWKKATSQRKPVWCYLENDPENGKKYGKLYNWYALTDQRGLAPKGWHIPTDSAWIKLVDNLGGRELCQSKLKSTSGFKPGRNGTNTSGMNCLPGGLRFPDGQFYEGQARWWSCVELPLRLVPLLGANLVYGMDAEFAVSELYKFGMHSVRCIKD